MALKLSIDQSNVGVPFTDAYARITTINATKDQVQYMVLIHATQDARLSNAKEVVMVSFQAPMPQGTILDGLYAHLKTQPGFETAVDV